ncbi:MAG: dihydroorotase [Deltaproteobacteria bacterium]|nr:dihydroorotase [Deltaproteobacteria bacterium]
MALAPLHLKNARLVDPSQGIDGPADILIEDGRVRDIVQGGLGKSPPGYELDDLSGFVVAPAFVDVHVHFRDPGQEYKEDIESGSRAAAAGGFGTVCCMANTRPVNDSVSITRYIQDRARLVGLVDVKPIGAVTVGLEGKRLAEIGSMVAAGAVAVSDDGRCVMDADLFRRALEYARGFDIPVITHAEDECLCGEGSMNEGALSTRLGIRGRPAVGENIITFRDTMLAGLTGARLHVAHVTTAQAVKIIREAKERGVRVTAEVTPHNLVLDERAVVGYNTNAKMNPPLRTMLDQAALREAIRDGTIDCIATDHAPHSLDEKARDFDLAPPGVIGLETAFPVMMKLVHENELKLSRLVELFTVGPARALGLDCGTLRKGAVADVVILDPEERYRIDAGTFQSKSRNCPFDGWEVRGRVKGLYRGGRKVWQP